ncbi:MAG: methyltransferase domain-containing protein [Planctomycetes bacterium]|nr:methyltransferase domain-containing protein [Planctomycetota bacterium]
MNINLPLIIEQRITELLGISGLHMFNQSVHKKRLNALREQMVSLSDDFAGFKRTEDDYSDAYFAYNFPFNLMKSFLVADRMKRDGAFGGLAEKKEFAILDIGCGDGAGMFGLALSLAEDCRSAHFSLTGVDSSGIMLNKCREMREAVIGSLRGNADINFLCRSVDVNINSGFAGKYDVIILANSLLEIIPGGSVPMEFITGLFGMLNEGGAIVIIEPALKESARRLMALRNELTGNGGGRVLSPCLHGAVCPLLEIKSRNEWCHQSLRWNPPVHIKILNQGLDREIDFLKFSYLVIAKNGRKEPSNGYLVVSNLLMEKGRKRCFLCTSQGRVELVRLDRHKTETNSRFDVIHKGDVLELQNHAELRPQYWNVKEDSKITIF